MRRLVDDLQSNPASSGRPGHGKSIGDHRIVASYDPGYSEKIRLLRVVLPVVAVVMLATLIIWPLFSSRHGGIASIDAGAIAMINARFVGLDDKNRPVTITADQVVSTQDADGMVSLKMPLADLTYDRGRSVAIRAENGQYDQKTGRLRLVGDVNLFQADTFELVTRQVEIDGKSRNAWSIDRVTGYSPNGSINAEGLKIINNGQSVVFTGRSRLVLTQPNDKKARSFSNEPVDPSKSQPATPTVLEQRLRSES
jgi:lipopolysaccharide export system protein LptC